MRRPEHDAADHVRAFLDRMADEAPAFSPDATGVVRRARRRLTITGVVAALVAVVLVLGSASAIDALRTAPGRVPADQSEPAPSARDEPSVIGRFDEEDLPGLVLRPGERPSGYGLRFSTLNAGSASATTVASSIYVPADALEEAGFVSSYYRLFLNRAWSDSLAPRSDKLDLLSFALLFEDADAARAGMEVITGPVGVSVRGWRSAPVVGLGDEGSRAEGTLNHFPTVAFVWRVDNVVFFLATQGGALSVDTMRSLAGTIEARVG